MRKKILAVLAFFAITAVFFVNVKLGEGKFLTENIQAFAANDLCCNNFKGTCTWSYADGDTFSCKGAFYVDTPASVTR